MDLFNIVVAGSFAANVAAMAFFSAIQHIFKYDSATRWVWAALVLPLVFAGTAFLGLVLQ